MADDRGKVRQLTEQRAAEPIERTVQDEAGNVHRWRVVNLQVEAEAEPDVAVTLTVTATFDPV